MLCLISLTIFLFIGHSKIVALLLDNGADYSSSDSNGATPLHYASQNNYDVSINA